MGANDQLSVDEVEQARSLIAAAELVVCQLEIPLECSLHALKIGQEEGTPTILNTAPAHKNLSPEFYEYTDILCPNETETEILIGQKVESMEDAVSAARILINRGIQHVILTLGSRGVLLASKVEGGKIVHVLIPATDDKPVDTVGAGDAFIGGLSHFLSESLLLLRNTSNSSDAQAEKVITHDLLLQAVEKANVVSGRSVTARGTQTSFPHRSELPSELFE
jgi:ribokinase